MRRVLPWLPLAGGIFYSALEWPHLIGDVEPAALAAHALVCVLGAALVMGMMAAALWAARAGHEDGERRVAWCLTALPVGALVFGAWYSVSGPRLPALVLVGTLPPAYLCAKVLARDLIARLRARPIAAARKKALAAAALAALAVAFNRTYFPAHYFTAHVAVTLVGLGAALLAFAYLVESAPRGGLAALALALALLGVTLPFANDVRHALFVFSTETRSIVYVARRLARFDTNRSASGASFSRTPSEPACAASPAPVRRVLLVVIDSLRSDRLEAYGYSRATAPELARLSQSGTTFERAWSSAPATRAALRHLFAHPIDAHAPTLAGVLQRSNIPRRAVVPRHIATLTRDFLGGDLDELVEVPGDDDHEVARAAISRLERAGDDALGLTWVHLLSPHHPYQAHADSGFGSSDSDRYDGEIRHADRALGEIVGALERRGWLEETAVVVTSDHGEELREHGATTHNRFGMFDEEVHVPLVIRLPGATPRRVAEPVTHRDLAPTIAGLLGACAEALPGRSLVPAALGRPIPPMAAPHLVGPRTTFAGGALFDPPWKLTFIGFTRSYGLFHLDEDPHDRHNLYQARPEIAAAMKEKLERRLADPNRLKWDP